MNKITKIGGMEYFEGNQTVSLHIDTLIYDEDEVIAKNRMSCAFVPGQIENVKKYLGIDDSPEIKYLNEKWSEKVIADYEAYIKATESA